MARPEKQSASPLREERNKRQINISDLAQRIGYHPSYLSGVELGRLTPSREFLRRYAEGLGLEADALTAFEEQLSVASDSVGMRPNPIASDSGKLRQERFPAFAASRVGAAGHKEIAGRRRILEASIELIYLAAEQDGRGREILSTDQGPHEEFDGHTDLLMHWRDAVSAAMGRGWVHRHLWRLSDDSSQIRRLAGDIIQFSVFGKSYLPAYFTRYGALDAPYSLVIAEDIGGLLISATGMDRLESSSIYFAGNVPAVLVDHFRLLSRQTRPLLTVSPKESPEWMLRRRDAELMPGDRLSVSGQLSSLTRPQEDFLPGSPWRERFLATSGDAALVQGFADSCLAVNRAQINQSGESRLWQITSRQAILKWAETGVSGDLPSGLTLPDTVQERIARLRNIIDLLRNSDRTHFRIALLDKSEESVLQWSISGEVDTVPLTWGVKGANYGWFLTWYWDTERKGDIAIALEEPTVIAGLHVYFDNLWERISPVNRDTNRIIAWLSELIERLETQDTSTLGGN